jgi:hypothetical protein
MIVHIIFLAIVGAFAIGGLGAFFEPKMKGLDYAPMKALGIGMALIFCLYVWLLADPAGSSYFFHQQLWPSLGLGPNAR